MPVNVYTVCLHKIVFINFSYSAEGYLTGIVENIDDTEYSSTSLTYENGDITSISSKMNGLENKFIYEPGEESSTYHLALPRFIRNTPSDIPY